MYPASCGIGPDAINFHGEIILGSGTSFGNTENGVVLEGTEWAVYRNASRSTRNCLGFAFQGSVSPALSTSYALSLDAFNGDFTETFTSTLSFLGDISDIILHADQDFSGAIGQCGWGGGIDQASQNFDEGFVLFFNAQGCRWELTNGPVDFLIAYRESNMPDGVYTSSRESIDNIFIS